MQDTISPKTPSQAEASATMPTDIPSRALIRKGLLRQLFSGACMQRWNDKLRPCPLAELDKQAHKMIVAHLLWSRTLQGFPGSKDYALVQRIIEGALFDYLFRTVVTDIKPPLFYRILENHDRYTKLASYVFDTLKPVLSPLGSFWERFQDWHTQRDSEPEARIILRAAHLFASRWEFRLIEPLNGFDAEMPTIAASFDRQLHEMADHVAGLAEILDPQTAIARLANFSGQLRFQVRWTQIPRIPQTDVLGHMFLVGSLAYLYTMAHGACTARSVNNFFCGLYHDLPELLTRDIISPVKQSSDGLARLIREYEAEELDRRIFAPLAEAGETILKSLLGYYLGAGTDSEFCERIFPSPQPSARQASPQDCGPTVIASFAQLDAQHDRDEDHPLDGSVVKACDLLGAYLEAYESIRSGVSSTTLTNAIFRLTSQLKDNTRVPGCMHMDSLLADFD